MKNIEDWLSENHILGNEAAPRGMYLYHQDVREKLLEMQQEIDDLKFALEVIK